MKTKTLLIIILASLTLSSFGQQRPSLYQTIRQMDTLAEKKRAVLALARVDQVKVWRAHFAYITLTEELTPEQSEFLPRSLRVLETDGPTDVLDAEAKRLFDANLGRRVFNLGPWRDGGIMCQAKSITREIRETTLKRGAGFNFASFASFRGQNKAFGDCNCGQTSTNWSCTNSCSASSCTHTPDGCSIFYLYPCNGSCSTGGYDPEGPPQSE